MIRLNRFTTTTINTILQSKSLSIATATATATTAASVSTIIHPNHYNLFNLINPTTTSRSFAVSTKNSHKRKLKLAKLAAVPPPVRILTAEERQARDQAKADRLATNGPSVTKRIMDCLTKNGALNRPILYNLYGPSAPIESDRILRSKSHLTIILQQLTDSGRVIVKPKIGDKKTERFVYQMRVYKDKTDVSSNTDTDHSNSNTAAKSSTAA